MITIMSRDAQVALLPPRFVIAAPQGRSGKTTVSIAICAALKQRNLSVQPFKKGPDYIDPSWLTAASGRSCHNLDSFSMDEEVIIKSFQRVLKDADVAIIEGAMGLFDGYDISGSGSTAHLAKMLKAPVCLVVNTMRMTHSIAAMVMGYQHFDRDTHIAGIILNNVANSRHEKKLVSSVEQYCEIPVLGSIPKDQDVNITERHLGLIPFKESVQATSILNRIKERVIPYLNVDKLLTIARNAQEYFVPESQPVSAKNPVVKIGVLFDRVFNFYYPENLDALRTEGAEVIYINSLEDQELHDIDGLYIGGGFPELFLSELQNNKGLRKKIASAIENGLPVYAECAGLMYLCRGIHWQNKWYAMVGIIPADVEVFKRPQGHGYVEVEVISENPFFPLGLTFKGHEFHHSRLTNLNGLKFAYRIKRGHGVNNTGDGIFYKNIFASYTHLHALGAPNWAKAFVVLILRQKFKNKQPSINKKMMKSQKNI